VAQAPLLLFKNPRVQGGSFLGSSNLTRTHIRLVFMAVQLARLALPSQNSGQYDSWRYEIIAGPKEPPQKMSLATAQHYCHPPVQRTPALRHTPCELAAIHR
jgi:hypothetical protein